MPNIHAELVHLPGAARKAGKARKIRQPNPTVQRFKRRAQTFGQNRTSRAGTRVNEGGRFGRISSEQRMDRTGRRLGTTQAAITGTAIGGATAGLYGLDSRNKQVTRNKATIRRNARKLEKRFGGRQTVHLITDAGTRGAKDFSPKRGRYAKVGLGATAGTAALIGPQAVKRRKELNTQLAEQRTTITGQRAQLKQQRLAKRLMSDAEIRRRKKLQGHISQTTGALGLTALGGTLLATKGGSKATKAAFAAMGKERPGVLKPKKLKKATAPLLATSAGIGGAGAFNFASYTGAESRKRKQTMTKGLDLEMGFYGEEGTPVELPEIKVPIEKSWSPVASNYNPERSRHTRSKGYEAGLAGGSVGAGAGAAVVGARGARLEAKNRTSGQVKARSLPRVAAAQRARRAAAVKHGKVAGALAVGSAAAGLGAAAVHRGRKNSWQSYGKRSAFGVDHGEVSKKVLTQSARDKIKPKNFAMPGSKSYPIQDKAHARNALSRAAQSKTKGSYKAIAAKVHAKYPDIGRG